MSDTPIPNAPTRKPPSSRPGFTEFNSPLPWLAFAYPVVHAAPGLAGHRLFERNAAVGDVRVLRRDFPMAWFVLGNHVLVLDLMLRGLRRIQRTLRG